MRKLIASLALGSMLISLVGCLGNNSKPAENPIQNVAGHLILGKQVQAFKACRTAPEQSMWLLAHEKQLAYLRNAYEQLTLEPYEEVYVELLGRKIKNPEDCLACQAHQASFELQETLVIRAPQAHDCE